MNIYTIIQILILLIIDIQNINANSIQIIYKSRNTLKLEIDIPVNPLTGYAGHKNQTLMKYLLVLENISGEIIHPQLEVYIDDHSSESLSFGEIYKGSVYPSIPTTTTTTNTDTYNEEEAVGHVRIHLDTTTNKNKEDVINGRFNIYQKQYIIKDSTIQIEKENQSLGVGSCGTTSISDMIGLESGSSMSGMFTMGGLSGMSGMSGMSGRSRLHKRADSGCFQPVRKYLQIGIAADCTYISIYKTPQNALHQILQNINHASSIYESTFNIQFQLSSIYMLSSCHASPSGGGSSVSGVSGGIGGGSVSGGSSVGGGVSGVGSGANWNIQCLEGVSIQDRLNAFSQWRGSLTSSSPSSTTTNTNTSSSNLGSEGLWHLFSGCSSGATLGLAYLNTLCKRDVSQNQTEFRSGTGVTISSSTEWLTFAHEVGHSFGALHDCTSAQCSTSSCSSSSGSTTASGGSGSGGSSGVGGGGDCGCCQCEGCDCKGMYLMHPTSPLKNPIFSPCSISTICQKLSKLGSCLISSSTSTTNSGSGNSGNSGGVVREGICGNGIVESDEECDCGTLCPFDKCCTETCRYKNQAKCSDMNDGCCHNCQIMEKGEVCRDSVGECDPIEVCDGVGKVCPVDLFLQDGTSCGGGSNISTSGSTGSTGSSGAGSEEMYCASGICTNRNKQCLLLTNTTSCASLNTCQISCLSPSPSPSTFTSSSSPSLGNNQCHAISMDYIDGTICENGKCYQGKCVSTNGSSLYYWMAGLGVLLLLVLVGGVLYIRKRRGLTTISTKEKEKTVEGEEVVGKGVGVGSMYRQTGVPRDSVILKTLPEPLISQSKGMPTAVPETVPQPESESESESESELGVHKQMDILPPPPLLKTPPPPLPPPPPPLPLSVKTPLSPPPLLPMKSPLLQMKHLDSPFGTESLLSSTVYSSSSSTSDSQSESEWGSSSDTESDHDESNDNSDVHEDVQDDVQDDDDDSIVF